MGLFSNKQKQTAASEESAVDIMKSFRDGLQLAADEFARQFPVGTFVKTWTKGMEYDARFGYICAEPEIMWDEQLLSFNNIEAFKNYHKDKDEDASLIFWFYVPIDINNVNKPDLVTIDEDTGQEIRISHQQYGAYSFGLSNSRYVVKSSIEEYKEYMLLKYKKNIEESKQEIKQRREWIHRDKKAIRNIDDNLKKAVVLLEENYNKEINKSNIKTK